MLIEVSGHTEELWSEVKNYFFRANIKTENEMLEIVFDEYLSSG
jgi:hypothetical protein